MEMMQMWTPKQNQLANLVSIVFHAMILGIDSSKRQFDCLTVQALVFVIVGVWMGWSDFWNGDIQIRL